MSNVSQNTAIRRYLERGGRLTAMEALRMFGTFRLAARIHDLRMAGWAIESETRRSGGKTFAVYRYGSNA
jgi:hypothetical protein